MKRTKKIVIYTVVAVVLLTCGAVSYVRFALPDVGPAPDLKVELTPQRIERGKYLANNVTVCIDCHSTRDWSRFSAPLDSTSIGSGGEKFDARIGFPGEVYVPNITPHNLKTWTDGELFRAITAGVKKDGSAIFPIMPYKAYGKMDKEDILSIIAYLRTLPEKARTTPERKLDFPVNFIVNTMPAEAQLTSKPDENDRLAYGRYLVTSAACVDCHSKSDKGALVAGSEFGGGGVFNLPNGVLTSSNITPDKETGIGNWTKQMFVDQFRAHASASKSQKVGPRDFQTIMPWSMYGKMKTQDLEAIYSYLQTVKPIKNKVTRFQAN